MEAAKHEMTEDELEDMEKWGEEVTRKLAQPNQTRNIHAFLR